MLFSFPFFFLFVFSLFFLSVLSFSVFPFLFRFVFSSCRFSVCCIAFFAFLFSSLISLVSDSVFLLFRLGATPRAPCEPEVCVSLLGAVFFLAFLWLIFFIFFSLPSLFSIFRFWTSFVSSCLFLVVILPSHRFRFLLRLV